MTSPHNVPWSNVTGLYRWWKISRIIWDAKKTHGPVISISALCHSFGHMFSQSKPGIHQMWIQRRRTLRQVASRKKSVKEASSFGSWGEETQYKLYDIFDIRYLFHIHNKIIWIHMKYLCNWYISKVYHYIIFILHRLCLITHLGSIDIGTGPEATTQEPCGASHPGGDLHGAVMAGKMASL